MLGSALRDSRSGGCVGLDSDSGSKPSFSRKDAAGGISDAASSPLNKLRLVVIVGVIVVIVVIVVVVVVVFVVACAEYSALCAKHSLRSIWGFTFVVILEVVVIVVVVVVVVVVFITIVVFLVDGVLLACV